MGYNDRIFESREYEIIARCEKCNKKYKQIQECQISGSRMISKDVCPYCKHLNKESMTVEFHNSKI